MSLPKSLILAFIAGVLSLTPKHRREKREARAEAAKTEADARAKAEKEAQLKEQQKKEIQERERAAVEAFWVAKEKKESYLFEMTRVKVIRQYLDFYSYNIVNTKIIEELLSHFHNKYPETFVDGIKPYDFEKLISTNSLYQDDIDTFFWTKQQDEYKAVQAKYKGCYIEDVYTTRKFVRK